MDSKPDLTAVLNYLEKLQDSICERISAIDGKNFTEDRWSEKKAVVAVAVCSAMVRCSNRRGLTSLASLVLSYLRRQPLNVLS